MEIPIDMDAQSYNRNPLSANNDFSDDSRHLVINCAGCCVLPQAFCTYSPHGRNDYYLMYLYAGQLALSSGARDNGGALTLNAGQLFVFPPHTAFRYENGGNGEIRYLYVHFTGYGAAGLLADCAIPVGAVCSVGFPSDAEEKYRALFRLFILRGPCFDTAAAARFMDICVMFGRALAKESAKPSGHDRDTAPERGKSSARRIYTSLSYLHENLSKPLEIGTLAAMEHLGVSRYRMLFREVTGMSPVAYITGLRVRRAAELLSQTNLPMADIALSVGYEDPLYFSRVFRAGMHMSPAAYRKQSLEKEAETKNES
ncbi:MAG: helix-turn-helix domain-containing protein [Eubacteriales bacterium]